VVSPVSAPAPTEEILVIGAGIAGLTLAHGLKQAGFRVAIFERDESPTARDQGYRIHLDGAANMALRACLPPEVYDLFLTLSEPLGRAFSYLDERKRELGVFANTPPGIAPDDGPRALSRFTLRQLLLTGLAAEIRFGKTCTRIATTPTTATAHFADGTAHAGALLIGADGTGSKVAQSLLGDAAPGPTAAVAVIGRLTTTPAVRALLPEGRFERIGIMLGLLQTLVTPGAIVPA